MNPASDFFLLANPTASPTQKMTPRFTKMETSDPDNIVPNPVVTGLSKKGKTSNRRALVNKFPMAIKIPAIGKIKTGINIALENFCIVSMTLSFICFPPI